MALLTLFWIALMLACGFALIGGGRPERIGAAIIVIGCLATSFILLLTSSARSETLAGSVLIIDLAALAALLWLALTSDRFWPMFAVAFHGVAVVTSLLKRASPDILPYTFKLMQPFWIYPMLLALALGTTMHWRRSRRTRAKV